MNKKRDFSLTIEREPVWLQQQHTVYITSSIPALLTTNAVIHTHTHAVFSAVEPKMKKLDPANPWLSLDDAFTQLFDFTPSVCPFGLSLFQGVILKKVARDERFGWVKFSKHNLCTQLTNTERRTPIRTE